MFKVVLVRQNSDRRWLPFEKFSVGVIQKNLSADL
jgi:hypothetical protein